MDVAKIKELIQDEDPKNDYSYLNLQRNQKTSKDSEDEFMEMIEEDLEPAILEN